MDYELSFKTAVCTEYEQLLHECQRALETWRRRREQVAEARLTGKQIGDELQRLQANYARAYSSLHKHNKVCVRCRFVSKFAESESSTSSSYLYKPEQRSFISARKKHLKRRNSIYSI